MVVEQQKQGGKVSQGLQSMSEVVQRTREEVLHMRYSRGGCYLYFRRNRIFLLVVQKQVCKNQTCVGKNLPLPFDHGSNGSIELACWTAFSVERLIVT